MTIPFIDYKHVDKGSIEDIAGDDTVGLFHARGDETVRGDVLFNLRRLRRAIIAFEEIADSPNAEVAIFKDPESEAGVPILALVPQGGSDHAVVVAPRVDGVTATGSTDRDELVTADEEGSA